MNGRCVEVPGQPEVPPGAKVRGYPTHEKNNIVWIIELPEEPAIGAQVDPIHPAKDGPTAPVITLPGAAAADAEAADHE